MAGALSQSVRFLLFTGAYRAYVPSRQGVRNEADPAAEPRPAILFHLQAGEGASAAGRLLSPQDPHAAPLRTAPRKPVDLLSPPGLGGRRDAWQADRLLLVPAPAAQKGRTRCDAVSGPGAGYAGARTCRK